MRVEIVKALTDNYVYLVVCEQTGQTAVVDPGDADPVISALEGFGLEPTAIWNTHHHWDHTGGNEALIKRYPGLRVFGNAGDFERIPGQTEGLNHLDEVTLGGLRARVVHVPGHTRWALAYLLEGAVFTGDTLFGCGCGRLFEGTAQVLHRSLVELAGRLDDATLVYFGHEYTETNIAFALTVDPDNAALMQRYDVVSAVCAAGQPSAPSNFAEELATNPFLRSSDPAIRRTLSAKLGVQIDDDPLAVFAQTRALRDRF